MHFSALSALAYKYPTAMLSKFASAPRRTHRKRVSALQLSTDTTTGLPEYHQASATEHSRPQHQDTFFEDQVPSDKPPDYPDSAEEADEDTDPERQRDNFYVHQLPTSTSGLTASLRRKQRHYQHKRKYSASPLSATSSVDPYIDSLLERSVHALEMSNTLLQSSMTTHTSLSHIVSCDSPVDTPLEARAMNLPARMRVPWMEDLEEITKRVDNLFGNAEVSNAIGSSQAARLRLAHRTREDLIAPPPRALTQHIETDPYSMALSSTLGVRSNNSVYPNAEWSTSIASACLHSSPAMPVITDKPLSSSSTPAYAKLASFVVRRPSKSANATPSSSFTASPAIKRRNSSAGLRSSAQTSVRLCSRTFTNHESPFSHQRRPMTPPDEEASSSSSSSDGYIAKRTISSLRKILDEQPQVEETNPLLKKAHIFMPVTPPPLPVSGTSSATASISRMLTKKLHHSSTRPPSPPRSAMKGSRPTTPSSSSLLPPLPPSSSAINDTMTIPQRIAATVYSASSSGRSTPKRISFAELPEAHVSSRPDKFRDKGKRKGKGKSLVREAKLKGGVVGGGDGSEGDSPSGWFTTWFDLSPPMGATGLSHTLRQDEMEDRISRNWAGKFGGGGTGYDYLDEWGV